MVSTSLNPDKLAVPSPQTSENKARSAWRLSDRVFEPIDIAPLVFFRITFGLLMILEVAGYTVAGLVRDNWVRPEMHFTYFGFGWVPGLGTWTYALVGVCLVAAIGIMLGAFYRLSAAVFAFGFTWFYLMEQSNYMNHFYLICLLAFVALVIPADRALSIDVRRNPGRRAATVPRWTLLLVQAHMVIGYFFGGVAKINGDWLRGEPVRTWLHDGSIGRQLGPAFQNEFTVYALCYGGMLFDLLVVPFLIWRKTRLYALAAAIFFHLSNAYLFDIGVFPFLSIALTLLFLDPRWHRKVLRLDKNEASLSLKWGSRSLVGGLLAAYFAYHLFMPFRHWLYPGEVHWTEEGHRYSWHMMLRTKNATAHFIVEDKQSGKLWRVRPEQYLSRRQFRKMSVHPEMLLQFAHYLRAKWQPQDVAVYAIANVKLNDHEPALLINPNVDLAKEKITLASSDWILPFENKQTVPGRFRLAVDAPKR
ncbi:MAG TPA: HTTM domain-containing protein [Candidatus Kapabacteria bacterium]|nr:HTTM domain-containing protein [Candidatus Kapabacteria bacterium]